MARKHDPLADTADLLVQLHASMSGLNPDERRARIAGLLSARPSGQLQQTHPSRRGPRRKTDVTYQVRVELEGTRPPVWRRLEIASDLFLNEVHDIIQTAFGWTDSHLHEFAAGPSYHSRTSEHYLCPVQVEQRATGVPEEDVRLDEVLAKRGSKLFYLYDFGDDWMHVIKVEAVKPRDESAPRAVCLDGERPGPSEDCGGVWGYEVACAAMEHPDSAAAVADYARMFGDDSELEDFAPTPFDLANINAMLSYKIAESSGVLEALANAIDSMADRQYFQQMVASADLDAPIDIDADTAAQMVAPYTWLLNRVGTDGIKLTGAGYLPPAHVEAALAELGFGDEWIGKGNRENQTLPVLHLRESAQAMGLLHMGRGALVLSELGRELRDDPLALWWLLAEQMPLDSEDFCETHAGLLLLVALAGGSADDPYPAVARILDAIGWTDIDGTRMTPAMARLAAAETSFVLRRLRGFTNEPGIHRWDDIPTPQGVLFAKAALSTWLSPA
ncbi:plasmid pRiA4b ORF-3 family protein [Kribbella sp. NBC_01505]|uniref:plasmid pRiA4b ORF-3 family protein n=1 Tax=Kribbella sp. NBC_01505 TaxID=2903580 RepID=UPI003862E355